MSTDLNSLIVEISTMENETQIDLNYYLTTDSKDSFGMQPYYTNRLDVLKAVKEQLARLKSLEK